MARIRKIEVYRSTCGTFLVRVDEDVIEMDSYCTRPNGVNTYIGPWAGLRGLMVVERLTEIPSFILDGLVARGITWADDAEGR